MSDKVYLVHKSGERLGPFYFDEIQGVQWKFEAATCRYSEYIGAVVLASLGFTIEPEEPEVVTITRAQHARWRKEDCGYRPPWSMFVEASKGAE